MCREEKKGGRAREAAQCSKESLEILIRGFLIERTLGIR